MNVRIIPRLDIKGPNLVKGIHLEGLRVLGKPEEFARLYCEQGADELLYMDVVASLYQRNSLLDMVNKTSNDILIPLTVGGGLRTIEDMRAVLNAGADKVALNTAALNRPELLREAATRFGSSTIVLMIEAIRKPDGSYEAYTDNGRERTGVDAFEWAVRAAELGAGEIVVTSIDREGTGEGFDLDLTNQIARSVSVPVIASGGAGTMQHIYDVIALGQADAVCLASILHYTVYKRNDVDERAFVRENTKDSEKTRRFPKVQMATLLEIKSYLLEKNIRCRPSISIKAHD